MLQVTVYQKADGGIETEIRCHISIAIRVQRQMRLIQQQEKCIKKPEHING
jgi:hypothetical protein